MTEKITPAWTNLHNVNHTNGPVEGCPVCIENVTKAQLKSGAEKALAGANVGQGCVAQRPSVFERILPIDYETAGTGPLDTTLAQRGQEYGHYPLMARLAQALKTTMRQSANWHGPSLGAAKQESLDMIATKIARILCGNPNNPDSWRDIEGYARKAGETCNDPIPTATS